MEGNNPFRAFVLYRESLVAIRGYIDELYSGFFFDFSFEGLKNRFSIGRSSPWEVPGALVGASRFPHEEYTFPLLDDCVNAEMEFLGSSVDWWRLHSLSLI